MSSEIIELVPYLRNILVDASEETATATTKIADTFSKMSQEFGDFSSTFEKLENYAKISGEEGIEEITTAINNALEKGDILNLLKLSGEEITPDLEKASQTFRNISNDIPERKLNARTEEFNKQTTVLDSETETLNDITENPDDVINNQTKIVNNSKLKSVSDFFDAYSKTIKSIVITGIIVSLGAFLAVYISNYIKERSGCFLVSTDSNGNIIEQKIAGYSCNYNTDSRDKINHPFDKEIKAYLKGKQICNGLDVTKYGPCAGWCTIGKNSRLSSISVNIKETLTANKTLICRKATSEDAIFDFTNHFLKRVEDVVKDQVDNISDYFLNYIKQFSPIISIGIGLASSFVSYFLLKETQTKTRIIISIAIGIAIAGLFYFIIHNIKIKTKEVIQKYTQNSIPYVLCHNCNSLIRATHDEQYLLYTI